MSKSHLGAKPRLAAVILAGGRASRYGSAKTLIELSPGITILSRLIAEIHQSGVSDLAISANSPEPYAALGFSVITDLRPGLGPVGGIEAGLAHFRDTCDAILFLPCDLPAITSREISTLVSAFDRSGADVVFARTGSSFDHPLCSVIHVNIVPAVSEFIAEGHRKITMLWARLGAQPVLFEDDAPFFNVNTPDDLARWRVERTNEQI